MDGTGNHDQVLPLVQELAQRLPASLNLLLVVHTLGTLPGQRAASGWMLPNATRAILDIDEEAGRTYLEKIMVGFRQQGIKVSAAVRRGDPVQQILNEADSRSIDMIVLATHGKSGMDAFWAGSVAPKVVMAARTAVLLVPVGKK